MSNFQHIPMDLIREILKWYDDFQIQAAIQRKEEFYKIYSTTWYNILSDIRANTPAYKASVVNYDGLNISIYFRLPDCDIRNFELRALFNSWTYTLNRSALGMPRTLYAQQ